MQIYCLQINQIKMAAKKFKVGDLVRVKKRSEIKDTRSINERQLNKMCGKEWSIVTHQSFGYQLSDGSGFYFSDEMLEPIPAAKWYVGQEVWDCVLHPGETGRITHIESNGSITVDFNNVPCYYAFDSIYFRFISAVPYTFELPPQPEPVWIPEKWERVLVRDDERYPWNPHVFYAYQSDSDEYKYRVLNGIVGYKYCIPFDANKVGKV